jgi:hypothetical protein
MSASGPIWLRSRNRTASRHLHFPEIRSLDSLASDAFVPLDAVANHLSQWLLATVSDKANRVQTDAGPKLIGIQIIYKASDDF